MGESSLETIQSKLKHLGRSGVKIIAVSKTHSPESISRLMKEGQMDFGENRFSEARDKIPLIDTSFLTENQRPVFHHIGPLQTGNARQIPTLFQYIHGVSSMSALKIMMESALKIFQKPSQNLKNSPLSVQKPIQYLIQLNLTGEESKMGGMKEEELLSISHFYENDAVKFCGFMTMGPSSEDPVETREVFHKLRELRNQIHPGAELSMGMSGDWEIAVEEGATMIRLGTILFGSRKEGPWKKDSAN